MRSFLVLAVGPTPIVHQHTFGIRVASVSVTELVEAKTDGDVMGVQFYCSAVRYAVIQSSSKKDRPERLVIAYHDEDCLRDLIAAPSIIGLGFASREEAIANLEGHMSDVAPWKEKPRITAMFHATHANVELAGGHGLVKASQNPAKHSAIRSCGGHCPLVLEEHRVRDDPHGARSFFLVVLITDAWFTLGRIAASARSERFQEG